MRKIKHVNAALLVFAWAVAASGCAGNNPLLPAHDEVLLYDLPYDFAYLRALDAIQEIPGWELESTEKERGIIQVRNINYNSLDDADNRLITVLIKRVSRGRTSVELARESQHVIGGDKLLKTISDTVNREL